MNQLAIVKRNNKILSVFLEDDNLSEVYAEDETASVEIGDIYVGRIERIIKNINAIFVQIGNKTTCYLKGKGDFHCGDEVIVQVSRDSVKTKQPTVTDKLVFSGRYFVLTKEETDFRISSKIHDKAERERLISLKESFTLDGYSTILRTNAVYVEEEFLASEFQSLKQTILDIEENGKYKSCFSKLYSNPPSYIIYARDMADELNDRIITDDKMIYDNLFSYLSRYQDMKKEKLVFYSDESYPLTSLLSLEDKLKRATDKKVWLKSGASLVIEPTEALTSIDVNTDKAVKGNRNPETTFFKINCEAAKEIARQLRVRNLSGIIIVDFIDMKSKEHKSALLELLKVELKKDKIKTILVDMTPLGLVEITRMKRKRPLHEQLK